jgi:DNA-directed RNA polymerase specialized sigma24 family protein
MSADPERFDHSTPRSSLKIIYGIFRRRCQVISKRELSHDRQRRKFRRIMERLRETAPHRLQGLVIDESVLDAIVRIEEADAVRAALAELSTEAHALLLMLAEQEVTRLKLIEILGVNRNTFDTRLRALRRKLKQLLREHGVEVNAPNL